MSPTDQEVSDLNENSPLIGPEEQQLFEIADTRERADRLQELLVPKLQKILDDTNELVCEIYGEDALMAYRFPTTPAHRPGAKKTKSFDLATAGLAVDGQAWFFQQRFECTSEHLRVTMFGLRGLEGNPIVQVLKTHTGDAVRLLELDDYSINSSAFDPGSDDDELELPEFIARLRLGPDREWDGTHIEGPSRMLPIADLDAVWPVLFDFVALFPIFRAATHILQGEDDRFDYYSECFWRWLDQFPEEGGEPQSRTEGIAVPALLPLPHNDATDVEVSDFGLEGGFKVVFQRHRLREWRLRAQKLRDSLRKASGRLRCEVPGCGFDFFEVYGDLGRDFAHVHHIKPLSDRDGPEMTKLSDLAIVCANCHSMIHRGRKCRDLTEILPHRR